MDFKKELAKWGYNKGNAIDVDILVDEILPSLFEKQNDVKNSRVYCKNCKQPISVEDINNHLFMAIKSGGLIHWNCTNK